MLHVYQGTSCMLPGSKLYTGYSGMVF